MLDVVNMSSSKRLDEDDEEGGGLDGLDALVITEEIGSSDAITEADKAVAAVIKTKWTPEEVNDRPVSESYEDTS